MILVSIARRYARALFEAAGDGYESAGQELAALAQGIDGSKDVAALFANPSTPRELKNRMVEAAISQAGVSVLVGNTFRLLNDRDRIPYLAAIVRAFGALADEKTGRLRARITSATELPGQMAEQLRGALAQATNRKVEMTSGVDSSLIGGVVAQVGNIQYDGSLRTQLERLRRQLLGEA